MKKLIIIFSLFVMTIVAGCATTPSTPSDPAVTSGKTLLATQQTIVGLRDAIGEPCQQGLIPQSDCIAMDSWYQQSKPAYDAAVAAWNVGADSADYQTKKIEFEKLAGQIAAIAIKYGVEVKK